MARQRITDPKFWRYSLYAMPIMIPLALWGNWSAITAPSSLAVQIAVGIGIALLTYVAGGLLFWWNESWQSYWRERKDQG